MGGGEDRALFLLNSISKTLCKLEALHVRAYLFYVQSRAARAILRQKMREIYPFTIYRFPGPLYSEGWVTGGRERLSSDFERFRRVREAFQKMERGIDSISYLKLMLEGAIRGAERVLGRLHTYLTRSSSEGGNPSSSNGDVDLDEIYEEWEDFLDELAEIEDARRGNWEDYFDWLLDTAWTDINDAYGDFIRDRLLGGAIS